MWFVNLTHSVYGKVLDLHLPGGFALLEFYRKEKPEKTGRLSIVSLASLEHYFLFTSQKNALDFLLEKC